MPKDTIVQSVGHLSGVTGQCAVPDALLADLREGRLQSGEKLGLELAVYPVSGVLVGEVAGDVLVEQYGVGDTVGILTEALDADIDVKADVLIDYAEGNGVCRAVLVADYLLGVDVVNTLILAGAAAELEPLPHLLKGCYDALAQLTGEDGGGGGGVVLELAGLGAKLNYIALIDNDHALTVCYRNDGAVGDDVVLTLCVAAATGNALLTFNGKHVLGHCFTIEVFEPGVGKRTADGSQCSFDKTHSRELLSTVYVSLLVINRFIILSAKPRPLSIGFAGF